MAKTNLFRTADNFESYTPGQMIFEEGQPGNIMYVVKDGEVEILVGADVMETLDAGEIFGEMTLIEGKGRSAEARAKTECQRLILALARHGAVRRSAGARAKTACQVVPVNEQRFTFLVQQTPHFALSVMKTMAERLRNMNARAK